MAFVASEAVPICGVVFEVYLLGSPKRGFGFFVHSPDVIVLNGEEDKAVRVCLEERFRGEESIGFGVLVVCW